MINYLFIIKIKKKYKDNHIFRSFYIANSQNNDIITMSDNVKKYALI